MILFCQASPAGSLFDFLTFGALLYVTFTRRRRAVSHRLVHQIVADRTPGEIGISYSPSSALAQPFLRILLVRTPRLLLRAASSSRSRLPIPYLPLTLLKFFRILRRTPLPVISVPARHHRALCHRNPRILRKRFFHRRMAAERIQLPCLPPASRCRAGRIPSASPDEIDSRFAGHRFCASAIVLPSPSRSERVATSLARVMADRHRRATVPAPKLHADHGSAAGALPPQFP